jgi:hypothetical protein
VLLKLVFRGTADTMPHESGLVDRYQTSEQLDIVSSTLLEKDRDMMKK